MGIVLCSYRKAKELIDLLELGESREKNDAFTFNIDNKYYIFFDDTLPSTVIKFVLAHELGHFALGHEFKIKTEAEAEIEMEMEENQAQKNQVNNGNINSNINKLSGMRKRKDTFETEADMFALRLLAPSCILRELNVVNPSAIELLCSLPRVQAVKRAKRMKQLYLRRNFCMGFEEEKIFHQFKSFIESQKLKYL